MELLDRYLQAVKKHLPLKAQDDIVAELRANLESQLDDKEGELGRPLSQAEAEAWLKQIGPPMQVAARYKPQQYLVGPGIFPTYWFVLRLALGWALLIYLIVSATLIFAGENPSAAAVAGTMLRIPGIAMTVAAWVTLAFAGIEFAVTRCPGKWRMPGIPEADWSPASLPPVEREAAPGKKRRSYAEAVAEVVFGFLLLFWLLLVPRYPFLLMGPGAAYLRVSPFQLAPVWHTFYWWIVALNVAQLAWRCVDLLRESWARPRIVQDLAIKIFGLIPLALLLAVPDHVYVVLKHPALDMERYGGTLSTINQWTHRSFMMIAFIAVLQILWDIAQISLQAYRRRAAATR
jgi:hypothetical protein